MGTGAGRRARGATRFEFAICAMVFALLAGVLLHVVLRYRAEAELVGVRFQVANMRTALAGKIMEAALAGDTGRLQALVGTNPVALLEHAPPGYIGEVDQLHGRNIAPGSWVFDRKQQILVYLFSGNKSFSTRHYTHWSYRVESLCLPTNNAKPPGTTAAVPKLSVALTQVDG